MFPKLFSAAGLFVVLSIEKVLQHLLTGLIFVVDIQGIGKPDIGENIPVSDAKMALFNLAFALLFAAGVLLFIKGNSYGKRIIFLMACADIVLEFIFHGMWFITWSVLFSSAIILLVLFNRNLGVTGQKKCTAVRMHRQMSVLSSPKPNPVKSTRR
jgi:hypothetical protein